jgi:hypothetical protein
MNPSALALAARYLRQHLLRFVAISAAVLTPCFWHRRIFAADLGSHLYNAWLVQLIEHGQAPGLWIAKRWNNVLFDFLLSGLGSRLAWQSVEKIAVSLCVLVFFWGIFALACAATRRPPWLLVPCIAVITYGWTFQMGFFNYYLSIGLAFWGVAIFWRGAGWERLIAAAIAPVVVLAHPLGLFWLGGAAAYVLIAGAISRRYHFLLLAAATACLFLLHHHFWRHYIVEAQTEPLYVFTGADQLLLFSRRYLIPELALLGLVTVSIAVDLVRRRREGGLWASYAIPLQLYIATQLGVPFLPRGVHLPQYIGAVALLTERLTSVSAALLCCLLGVMRPSRWHLAASLAIAAVFFTFVYQDTTTINKMEAQVEQLVKTIPSGQRVMGTILPPPGSRVPIQHILDQACIGRCFSYGNYEPGSAMFRVRALPGNPYVLSDYMLAVSMEEGTYTVQPQDLPVYQVYQCSERGSDLCIASLDAGEENDSLGVHPDE